jgi:MFS family permease
MVPITSLLFARRLIARFGAAAVVTAGIVLFCAGLISWAAFIDLEPNLPLVMTGIVLTGIGVGLAFPTLMGVGTSALPASAFATGSGVINMIRQAALAIGVAIFVAIIGSPASPGERLAAFERGWWVIAAITALGLIPTFLFVRVRRMPPETVVAGAG